MGEEDCDVKPRGDHVHLQMERANSGHWFLPIGRFHEVMTELGQGHLSATTDTPDEAE